jgi:oligopeptide transport system substrate-binding protein
MPEEPSSLDPHKLFSDLEGGIAMDLLEGLTTLSAADSAIPGVAERWETSPDGLDWTFHIRADARWSDGKPVTAEDFVYSFHRAVDPATAAPFGAELGPIAGAKEILAGGKVPLGVTAPDPATLKIHLAEPTPWFLSLLANPAMLPVPRQAIEQAGESWARPGHFVSNGAYLLTEWTPHGEIRLTRNPKFHDAASVRIETVRHIFEEDRKTALKRYLAGELDTVVVPADDLPWVRAEHGAELHGEPWLETWFLLFNQERPSMRDRRIREALSLAIDREALVTKVDPDHPKPAYEFVPADMPDFRPSPVAWVNLPMPARLEKARALLAELDSAPQTVTIKYATNDLHRRDLLAIAQMWKTGLGIETKWETRERRVLDDEVRHHDFEITSTQWDADFPDPWNFLANFRSDARDLNFGSYVNADYDALLDRSRTTATKPERMAILGQAEAILMADQPLAPIEHGVSFSLVNPKLRGWEGNAMILHLDRFFAWE